MQFRTKSAASEAVDGNTVYSIYIYIIMRLVRSYFCQARLAVSQFGLYPSEHVLYLFWPTQQICDIYIYIAA